MLRLCCFLLLVVTSALASKGSYELCIEKIQENQIVYNNSIVIPVDAKRELIYTKTLPKRKILKADPFLSLYLVQKQEDLQYPFTLDGTLGLETVCKTDKQAQTLQIMQEQIGLNQFAKLNKKLKTPALYLNSCCLLEGIVTPEGLIQKEYLQHFLKNSSKTYSDIGVRLGDELLVEAVDPFLKNNPFRRGDRITHLDGKKLTSSAEFMRKILFSKQDKRYKIAALRDTKSYEFEVQTYKRMGGAYLVDTFLEQKGIYTDKSLTIRKLSLKAQNYNLKLGDQILQVNGKKVSTHKELRENLYGKDAHVILLLQREQFQFFIHLQ